MNTPVTSPGEYVQVATLPMTCAATLPSTAIASAISIKRNLECRLTSSAPTHMIASANAFQATNSRSVK